MWGCAPCQEVYYGAHSVVCEQQPLDTTSPRLQPSPGHDPWCCCCWLLNRGSITYLAGVRLQLLVTLPHAEGRLAHAGLQAWHAWRSKKGKRSGQATDKQSANGMAQHARFRALALPGPACLHAPRAQARGHGMHATQIAFIRHALHARAVLCCPGVYAPGARRAG